MPEEWVIPLSVARQAIRLKPQRAHPLRPMSAPFATATQEVGEKQAKRIEKKQLCTNAVPKDKPKKEPMNKEISKEDSVKSIAAQVIAFRRNDLGLKAFEIDAHVYRVIANYLARHGTFHYDEARRFYFNKDSCKLIRLDKDIEDFKLLLREFGLNATHGTFKAVASESSLGCPQGGKGNAHSQVGILR